MQTDVLIIGGGIAGAGVAWALGDRASCVILEAEDQPGYHTTGRSAAFYAETYGGPTIQPLTTASKGFLFNPPEGFAGGPLVTDRGALHVFRGDQVTAAHEAYADMARRVEAVGLLDRDTVLDRVPILRPNGIAGAIDDRDCRDLEVARIHQGFLAGARRTGTSVCCSRPVTAAQHDGRKWHVTAGGEAFCADLVVNAAGSWADQVAALFGVAPLGLAPLRRTIVIADTGKSELPANCPLVLTLEEDIYFKPEAGHVLVSPADETPSPACDVQPEELDVALTIDRFHHLTSLEVIRIASRWAGLRTFAPDRTPVFGHDPRVPGFFWCAGQGGYGIQTAPAAAQLCAALIAGTPLADDLVTSGVDPAAYAPDRLI